MNCQIINLLFLFFLDATVIADVDKDAKVWRQEIFGPVTTIHKYSNFLEAIDLVNDSEFGLQAGIFTNDLQKSFYAYEVCCFFLFCLFSFYLFFCLQHLEVGGVVVNDVPSARVDIQAYGGIKSSGSGREGVRFAMEDLTELRVMVMKEVSSLPKE